MKLDSFFENKVGELHDYINFLYNHELNEDIAKKVFESFLSYGGQVADYEINRDDEDIAYYNTATNCVCCSLHNLIKDSYSKVKKLQYDYNIFEKDKLLVYIQIFELLHEIMHAYQFNKREVFFSNTKYNCQVIDTLYAYYLDAMKTNVETYIRYRRNQHNYFVERNASLEAMYILEKVSKLDKTKILKSYMSSFLINFEHLGYQNNRFGSIKETYKKTKQTRAFNRIYGDFDIPFSYKLRYGLPLSIEEYDLYWDRIDKANEKDSKILKI